MVRHPNPAGWSGVDSILAEPSVKMRHHGLADDQLAETIRLYLGRWPLGSLVLVSVAVPALSASVCSRRRAIERLEDGKQASNSRRIVGVQCVGHFHSNCGSSTPPPMRADQ